MARTTSKSKAIQSAEAEEIMATPLSGAAVSALNRTASAKHREKGLAPVSFGTASLPKTVGGAFRLMELVGGTQDEVLEILEEWQGHSKRDLLQQVAPKKARKVTKKAPAKKTAAKKTTAKPKASTTKAKVQQSVDGEAKAINVEAAVKRLAGVSDDHWLRPWWAAKHPAEAKKIGLKADGTVKPGSILAKAIG